MRSVLWLAVAALTLAGTLLRAGEGTWVWRADIGAAGIVGGVPMEWEWIDVAQSAWLFEGNPRWLDREWGLMMGQNLIRFLPGAAVSLAGAWAGSAWNGALLLTWLCWLAACAGTHQLYLKIAGEGERAGAAISALLTAASPGFSAFAGNIDAHQFGYAAAPLALLALPRWGTAAGAAVFLANATLELGAPLLAMVWLYHVPREAWGRRWSRAARRALYVTAVFLGLQAAWWGLAHVVTLGQVVTYNEGLALVADKVTGEGLDTAPLDLARRTLAATANAFGGPAVIGGLAGLAFLPRRGRLWVALWTGLVLGVAILTRGHPRIIFLAFPAVYVAAAACVDGVGMWLARWVPAAGARVLVRYAVALFAVGWALRFGFGDVLGDLSLVRAWWHR